MEVLFWERGREEQNLGQLGVAEGEGSQQTDLGLQGPSLNFEPQSEMGT